MKPHTDALMWMIMEGRPLRMQAFIEAGFPNADTWLCMQGYIVSRLVEELHVRFYVYEVTETGRRYVL